jgi:hypothetical protein
LKARWPWRSFALRRLESALETYRPQLERRIAGLPESEREKPWTQAANDHLQRAHTEAEQWNVNAAWEQLSAAKRMEILGIDDLDELKDRMMTLRLEAEQKLHKWRKAAVAELTDPKSSAATSDASAPVDHGSTRADPPYADAETLRGRLLMATQLFDDHSQNEYFKLDLYQGQIRLQLGVLVVLVLLLTAVFASGFVPLARTGTPFGVEAGPLAASILLGMLGASLSVLQSLVQGPSTGRIPERMATGWVTIARPFIGAASALVAYVLFGAGFITLGASTTAALLAVAFISGFSERYITSVVTAATEA